MKPFEQEFKKKLEHFIKSKIDVSSHFGINVKIKLSEHSKKIDVSEQFFKKYQNKDKNRCIRVKKMDVSEVYRRRIRAKYCIRAKI